VPFLLIIVGLPSCNNFIARSVGLPRSTALTISGFSIWSVLGRPDKLFIRNSVPTSALVLAGTDLGRWMTEQADCQCAISGISKRGADWYVRLIHESNPSRSIKSQRLLFIKLDSSSSLGHYYTYGSDFLIRHELALVAPDVEVVAAEFTQWNRYGRQNGTNRNWPIQAAVVVISSK
jgi:hypothetical protein